MAPARFLVDMATSAEEDEDQDMEEGHEDGQPGQPPNPKGRSKGKLGKPSGDLHFGYGQRVQIGVVPRSAPAAVYGQQGLAGVRQGCGEPVWSDMYVDGVAGFKLVVGDIPEEWTIDKVSLVSLPSFHPHWPVWPRTTEFPSFRVSTYSEAGSRAGVEHNSCSTPALPLF